MYIQPVLQETDPGRHGLVHDHGRPFTSINSLRPAVLKVCQLSEPAPDESGQVFNAAANAAAAADLHTSTKPPQFWYHMGACMFFPMYIANHPKPFGQLCHEVSGVPFAARHD